MGQTCHGGSLWHRTAEQPKRSMADERPRQECGWEKGGLTEGQAGVLLRGSPRQAGVLLRGPPRPACAPACTRAHTHVSARLGSGRDPEASAALFRFLKIEADMARLQRRLTWVVDTGRFLCPLLCDWKIL